MKLNLRAVIAVAVALIVLAAASDSRRQARKPSGEKAEQTVASQAEVRPPDRPSGSGGRVWTSVRSL